MQKSIPSRMIQKLKKQLIRQRDVALGNISFNSQLSKIVNGPTLYPEIEDILPNADNYWAISHHLSRFLAYAAKELGFGKLLEFGAGTSSLILATALSMKSGGQLTTVEQNPEWCREQWNKVKKIKQVDSQLIESKPLLSVGKSGLYYSFKSAASSLAKRGPFDFVLIDAPQWFYGRDGALSISIRHLNPNALIVLDDAGRRGEQWTIFRWLQSHRGLDLVYFDKEFGGRGLALLLYNGNPNSYLNISTIISSVYHTVWSFRKRRRFISNPIN